jgi:hypothetical protein
MHFLAVLTVLTCHSAAVEMLSIDIPVAAVAAIGTQVLKVYVACAVEILATMARYAQRKIERILLSFIPVFQKIDRSRLTSVFVWSAKIRSDECTLFRERKLCSRQNMKRSGDGADSHRFRMTDVVSSS